MQVMKAFDPRRIAVCELDRLCSLVSNRPPFYKTKTTSFFGALPPVWFCLGDFISWNAILGQVVGCGPRSTSFSHHRPLSAFLFSVALFSYSIVTAVLWLLSLWGFVPASKTLSFSLFG